MSCFALRIELLEDVVASQRSATQGGHRGLDYIPGAMLLGAAAAKLYHTLDTETAYDLFHSGAVRFGNGYPICHDSLAWPIPNCWHHPKMEPATSGGRLIASAIQNFQFGNTFTTENGEKQIQPKQLRNGFVSMYGDHVSPETDMRMKTAIEPGTGRVAQGQLFGYDSIQAGQAFGAIIEFDPSAEGLADRLRDTLLGEVQLGRSRSSEYGRVQISPANFSWPSGRLEPSSKLLTLWLLSDVALIDENGQPTLDPRPEYLGLSQGEVVWKNTFLRHRSYSPWNGKRQQPDLERFVLTQGSVIQLRSDTEYTADDLAGLEHGVGLHREQGLGRVWVNPEFLAHDKPRFEPPSHAADADPSGGHPIAVNPFRDSALLGWLQGRDGGVSSDTQDRRSQQWTEELRAHYRIARRVLGRDDVGPSRTQWGRVLEATRTTKPDQLLDVLFEREHCVVPIRKTSGWADEFYVDREWMSFRDWLKKQLESATADAPELLLQNTAALARNARDLTDKRGDHG